MENKNSEKSDNTNNDVLMVDRKPVPSKTIVVSSEEKNDFKFKGVKSVVTSTSGSHFVVFDSHDNAESALKSLKNNDVKCKYCYYRVFFKLNDVNLSDKSYDNLKKDIIETLKNFDDTISVLFFRLYKNKMSNELKGNGNLTVDTMEHLNNLVEKKYLTFRNGKLQFEKFIMTKRRKK